MVPLKWLYITDLWLSKNVFVENISIQVLPDSYGMENRRGWGPVCFSVQVHSSPALKYLLLLPEIRKPLACLEMLSTVTFHLSKKEKIYCADQRAPHTQMLPSVSMTFTLCPITCPHSMLVQILHSSFTNTCSKWDASQMSTDWWKSNHTTVLIIREYGAI